MTRIGHDQNRPMIRIGFYGTASDIAQWEESLAGRLPPFEIVELMSDAGASCDVALVWAPPVMPSPAVRTCAASSCRARASTT